MSRDRAIEAEFEIGLFVITHFRSTICFKEVTIESSYS